MDITAAFLRSTMESTLLNPVATEPEVEKLCLEAAGLGVFGVCVAPCRVGLAKRLLAATGVKVVSVAGFPLGFETREAKAREVADLIGIGADEVDVVLNQGFVAGGEWEAVGAEARAMRSAAGSSILKVILETGRFAPRQLAQAARIWVDEGVDYLKTSTGFGPRGASAEDVHFLKKIGGDRVGVKAAGGIRTYADAKIMIEAGAARIGTSSASAILEVAGGVGG